MSKRCNRGNEPKKHTKPRVNVALLATLARLAVLMMASGGFK